MISNSGATSSLLNFIDGRYVEGTAGRTFENFHPADHSLLSVVHEAGPRDVDAAVNAASRALDGPWGRMPLEERGRLLHRVSDGIAARAEAFVAAEVNDTGKPISLAASVDVPRAVANIRTFADLVKAESSNFFETATPDGAGAFNYSLRRPKGVIGIICPWNYPLLLMTWKLGPALACGNTVVVKPSEETPTTATLLGEVMNEAGVPPGVYNVVNGFGPGSTGEYVTSHPGVAAITFTGETVTGQEIMKAAAVGVRDVSFELGGKNAAIVFADCDFDKTMEGMTRAVFSNCGQVCLNTERVYVERPLFDRFVAGLKAQAEGLKRGNPFDTSTTQGSLISSKHREKVLSYYSAAKSEGAKIVTGGGVPKMDGALDAGAWIEPTIWTGLPESSRIVREEIFGPCCHIQPFDAEESAVAMANDTPYGLCASVWTGDLSRANRVARAMQVGTTWVNCWFLRDLRVPFGGSKHSGIGREGGSHSLEFFTELQNVCVKL